MGGGGGEERLGLWCTFEVASPTVHTTFEGGGSWGEGGRSISAATSNLLSTSRITESALWNLLKVRVRGIWKEGCLTPAGCHGWERRGSLAGRRFPFNTFLNLLLLIVASPSFSFFLLVRFSSFLLCQPCCFAHCSHICSFASKLHVVIQAGKRTN